MGISHKVVNQRKRPNNIYTVCPIYIEPLKNLEERERYEEMFQIEIEQHERGNIILLRAWCCGDPETFYKSEF